MEVRRGPGRAAFAQMIIDIKLGKKRTILCAEYKVYRK